jgi:hypothetical protein
LTGKPDTGVNRAAIDVLTGVVRSRTFEISTVNPAGGLALANGLEMQSATQMYLNQGGLTALKITGGVVRINSTSGLTIGASGAGTNLVGALNILEQYQSTSAQRFSVYNTYTSATSYERGVFDWITTANTLRIGTEKGSTNGTARDLVLVTDGTTRLTIGATTGNVTLTAPITLKGYTVATLPTGVQGHKAFVTDALGPTYLVAVVAGGAVITEVFHNGTAWVCS